jgi:hypothetical protein
MAKWFYLLGWLILNKVFGGVLNGLRYEAHLGGTGRFFLLELGSAAVLGFLFYWLIWKSVKEDMEYAKWVGLLIFVLALP